MTPGSMKVARLKFMMTKSVMMPWYSGTAHMFFSKIYHCTHLVGGKITALRICLNRGSNIAWVASSPGVKRFGSNELYGTGHPLLGSV